MDRLIGCTMVLVIGGFLIFGIAGVLWLGVFSIPIGIGLFIFGKLMNWV